MAQSSTFICECGFKTGAWDEGNPYIRDPQEPGQTRLNRKRHVYHPNPEREFAIGNDRPHICLSCFHEFNVDDMEVDVDGMKPRTKCTKCKSEDIIDIRELGGRICPKCKVHALRVDGGAIS